jgi:broad specificity phosphatase PhoE
MRAELTIVRHCQSQWNLEKRCQGAIVEPALTSYGRRQARRSAKQLQKFHYDAVYSSDQIRAYETGRIIAAGLGLRETRVDSRLREMSQGRWEGMLYTDIKAQYRDLYKAFLSNPVEVTPPGGEAIQDLAQRVSDALNEISARHSGQRILIVSHEIPLAVIRCIINGRPLAAIFQFMPANGEWSHCPWPPVAPAGRFAASQQIDVYRRAFLTK